MATSAASSRLGFVLLVRATSLRRGVCRPRCAASGQSQPVQSEASIMVPRIANLKELSFDNDGRLTTSTASSVSAPVSKHPQLVELFLATVEASAQVKNLETLSGRLAMVAFFVAISMEYLTGSGVFAAIDQAGLQRGLALSAFAACGAGAFAVAMRGKENVTDILSSGCQDLVDSTVDNLVDALFFEDSPVVVHSADTKKPPQN